MMKRFSKLYAAAMLALVLLLAACSTTTKPTAPVGDTAAFNANVYVQQVATAADRLPQAITAKLKFSAQMGQQDVGVGGQLRMKRNDVIRLQLMALGVVEAARLEFTPDYVLLMDRINKQYVKARYDELDFLRRSGINFYSLQALFWNQLFEPGRQKPLPTDFNAVQQDGGIVAVSLAEAREKLSYEWLTNAASARISSFSAAHPEARLSWQYADFKTIEQQQFPTDMTIKLQAAGHDVTVGLQLSNLAADADWESRTTVSQKFKQVPIDDILKRLTAL